MSASPQSSMDTYFDSHAGAEILHERLEHEDYGIKGLLDIGDDEQSPAEDAIASESIDVIEQKDEARTRRISSEDTFVMEAGPPSEQDQEALFRHLMKNHQRRLYRFVVRYIDHPDDAADITQQAFVEAARTIASFRGDSKLSTWLYGIAMNMVRNYLSRAPHRVYRFESDEILGGLPCGELDPSDSLAQRELLAMVEQAFSGLPPEMSEVLSLVAIDEISYQDAADILAIPLGTVRSRVSRARAVLRNHFEESGIALKF